MSDTSTETTQGDAKGQKPEAKVPVQAVAEARAGKRAAETEADQLRQENERLRQSMIEEFQSTLEAAVSTAVEKATAPLKAEAEKAKLGMKLQLNEQQIDAVYGIQAKFAEMSPEEALHLARMRQPDLFPSTSRQAGFDPRLHGAVPATGAAMRQESGPKSYAEQKRELFQQAKSPDEVKSLALGSIASALQRARQAPL